MCSEESNKPRLSVAYTSKSMGDVDIKDIKAAVAAWIRELGGQAGFQTESYIYDDIASLIKDYQKGKIDLLVLQSLDYFAISKEVGQEFAVTKIKQGKMYTRYVLLISSDTSLKDIKSLKSKKISITVRSDLGMAFMDTLLLKAKLPEARRFFGEVLEKNKESQAILAVFFGQADVCITTEMAFKTAVELNPQVGKKLRVIATSPELIETISLFSNTFSKTNREKFIEGTIKLCDYPRGRQVLLLFNADKNVPLLKENMVTTQKFVEEYLALKEKK